MKIQAHWAAAALLAASLFTAQAAPIMAEYDMESSDSSLSEDPFGVAGGPYNGIQLSFTNILFKTPGSNPFALTGFDIYRLDNVQGSAPGKLMKADLPTAVFIGATGPCTGYNSPTANNPVSVGIITCAFSGAHQTLTGFPMYVLPHAGSAGIIARDNLSLSSSVNIGGADVPAGSTPEPSTAIGVLLGAAAMSLVRWRRGSR